MSIEHRFVGSDGGCRGVQFDDITSGSTIGPRDGLTKSSNDVSVDKALRPPLCSRLGLSRTADTKMI